MKKKIYNLLSITVLLIVCSFNSYSQEKSLQQTQNIPITDPGCTDPPLWYFDKDGDGFGNPNIFKKTCDEPTSGNWVINGDDCNDDVFEIKAIVWYVDADKDGYGSAYNPIRSCTQPLNYVDNNSDCDDTNPNISTVKWYLNVDINGDGAISDLDGVPVMSCTKPAGNYVAATDTKNHWIHQASYDTKGQVVTASRVFFDDLGKSDVSLSKDFVYTKIWGTETTYDDFGRPDKTSFIAPSSLDTFEKVNFLKSEAQTLADALPVDLPVGPVTSSKDYKATKSITANGTISNGLLVTFAAPSIVLKENFKVTATAGSSFKITPTSFTDAAASTSLANYYSDSNTDEPYQATATHPFSENNYDTLNPGNIINVVGGNKINGDWRTGYSYTVPAAQEMYYAYGSQYFNDNRDVNSYISYEPKIYPEYDNLGLTWYVIKVIKSEADITPTYSLPTDYANALNAGAEYFDLKANTPLEIGKIYKVLRYGNPTYVQILMQPSQFRNVQNLWPSMKITDGNWSNYEEISEYNFNLESSQKISTVLQNSNNIIAGLKSFKTINVDANGVENVSFTDSDGKILAGARSGGNLQYPVRSLIGPQGFIDIHLPVGCGGTLNFIGNDPSLYNVYNLKTGALLTNAEKGIMPAGIYRIELISKSNSSLGLTYFDKVTGIIDNVVTANAGVTYKVNYYDYSLNLYNKTGQLIKSIQPNGYVSNTTIVASPAHMASNNFASNYQYNALGQLIETSSPDEGISKFAYRKDGQIRYSQSALQATTNGVSYTNYDDFGRSVESGVITGSAGIWSLAIKNPDGALISGTSSEQTFTIYDYPENNTTSVALPVNPTNLTLAGVLGTAGITAANYIQNNLSGNVAITYTKPGATISAITWYSYDLYGRTEWIVQYNEGIGAKTIHYEYDYKGNVKKVIFQKDKNNSELFAHEYTYNANDALIQVKTTTDITVDPSKYVTHADYNYYKTGELKRINIGQGAQGLDYVYTLDGQLKSINHPSLEVAKDPGGDGLTGSANALVNADLFGLTLDYHNGDYLRTGRNITSSSSIGTDYNGNIKAARWANKGIAGDFSGSTAKQSAYLYDYNRNNWLTNATYGNSNTSTAIISTATNFSEGGLEYDANGNILKLKRTNSAGITLDDLKYSYNKNQLDNITDSAGLITDPDDIKTQNLGNYEYYPTGQLKRNNNEKLDYIYNVQGLVIEVKKDTHTLVRFFYNERGQRIKKESYSTATPYSLTSTTFYVLDLSGNVMAIYLQSSPGTLVQTDLPIYGLSRLGSYNRASPNAVTYEITDHLGNVRAVVQRILGSSNISQLSALDYYPFGEQLKGRNMTGVYRYAFQGQELDTETRMEAFQLRLWDGRIGRWISTDPMMQYESPYLGMGNNPLSLTDPDGGFTEGCCPGLAPKINNLRGFSQEFTASFAGFFNAWGSNMIFGSARFDAEKWSNSKTRMNYRYGQLAGDISSIVWGTGEFIAGGIMAGGGVILVPFTGGLSLAGTVSGAALAAHGTSVIILGGLNTAKDIHDLSDSFSRKGRPSGGNSQQGPGPALRNGLKKVKSGEIEPHDIYEGRESPKWAGAEEYKVPEGGPQSGLRILKLIKQDGTVIYGWVKNHNYSHVTPF